MTQHGLSVLAGLMLLGASATAATTPSPDSPAAKEEAQKLNQLPPVAPRGAIDHSGRKQKGRASYYAKHFTNHKMANGKKFSPNSDVAASKTLPLGTTAKITNTENGKSALVSVQDRGPHVRGRLVDVTPTVADRLGMKKDGVSPVVVAPVAVPQPDGAVKLGAGAADASPQEIKGRPARRRQPRAE